MAKKEERKEEEEKKKKRAIVSWSVRKSGVERSCISGERYRHVYAF